MSVHFPCVCAGVDLFCGCFFLSIHHDIEPKDGTSSLAVQCNARTQKRKNPAAGGDLTNIGA